MLNTKELIQDLQSIGTIALGWLSQCAGNLMTSSQDKAEALSLEEMSRRVKIALRALQGEGVSTSGAATTLTTAKTSLQLAQEMVESYKFDEKTGVSTFTVPAGVTDVKAIEVLNEYFRKNLPRFGRDAVYAGDLEWFENLPKKFSNYCNQRDYVESRQITVTGVAKDTRGINRDSEDVVLKRQSLVFSDPRDQAIAAALHACKHNGQDLFEDLWVRGSVPGFALGTGQDLGVVVVRFVDGDVGNVAASGSRSPELK